MVFRSKDCHHCVKLIVRTVNVLEKIESTCLSLKAGDEANVETVCRGLKNDQHLITLFSENSVPVSLNCFFVLLRFFLHYMWLVDTLIIF